MALNSLGLGFVFTARDLASAKMTSLERRFSSLDDRVSGGTERITGAFRELGVGLAVFTAGAATVAGAFALADAAGRFEQAIAAVAAVSGATATELEALRNAAIDAGIETQFSPTEATVGLRELAQAGFNAQESIGLLRPVLDLAAGSLGELSPQAAAGLASQAMKAFGISVEGAGVAVDQMLQAVNVFALNASELPLALGTASRGAQALNQSLSETLIALGLVKNVIPGVERASTATAVAMERLADPQVQQRLRGIGVAVVDSQGGFRSFLDVLGDMAPALDRMTEAQRSAFLLQTFGREALGGVNAILTQVTNGIRTNTGETVRGAQAIAYLRRQFEEAGGTAGQFASKMLDTFAGQKQLLRGSLETLAIVLGEPFAQVLKPVVAAVVEALNLFLRFVRAVPAPVKKAFAGFIVAAGAVVALIGAVIAAKAGIALLAIGFKALGISLGGIIATMLPAILIVAALAAVIAGFVVAFQKNLGGIGDFARRIGERVTLFFNGIKQLFEQGGFSGAVRDELNRAENQGLKQFLIRVYQIAYRIQQIWEGFKEGFTRTIEEARPVFQDLVAALSELGNEIAALFTGAADGAASLPSSEFRSFGQIAGSAIATVVTWLTKLIAIFARITGGIIAGFRSMMEYIGPAFETVGFALGELKAAWNTLTGATNDSSDAVNQSTSGWRTLGEVLGKIVGAAVTVVALALAGLIQVVTAVIWVVNVVKDAFIAAGTWIGETAAKIYLWFTETLPAATNSAVESVVGFFTAIGQFFVGIGRWFSDLFSSIAEGIKSFLRPVVDFFAGVGRAIRAVFDAIADFVIKLLRKIPDALLPASLERLKRQPLSTEVRTEDEFAAVGRTQDTAARAEAATSSMPAAADSRARMGELAQLEANMMAYANSQAKERGQAPPFTVNVQVDGETVARAVNNAQQGNASRAFSPVPAY
jgi:TP901 family phage tail tape measure protein